MKILSNINKDKESLFNINIELITYLTYLIKLNILFIFTKQFYNS
jgi:hypothetical protein